MKLKQKRNRNPVYERGYVTGFNEGKTALVNCIVDNLQTLQNEPGIGPATWEKIERALVGVEKLEGEKNE